MPMKYSSAACLFSSLLFLCACSPNVETQGHMLDDDWKNSVKQNVTTRDDVLAAFGSPSTVSSFGEETWYYISMQRKNRAFLKPAVTNDEIVQLTFNPDGTVKDITTYSQADMKDFSIADRTTPTEGHQMTVLEQTLGNLGRFNAPSGQKNPRRR